MMEDCQRPYDAVELVDRFRYLSTVPGLQDQTDKPFISGTVQNESEGALRPLIREMIIVANDAHDLAELIRISAVARDNDYTDLLRVYANAIIKGKADGNLLNPSLLYGLSTILRNAHDPSCAREALAYVMGNLQQRLVLATDNAGPETQYHLLMAVSTVLDAMVVNKISGISRTALHKPLLDQLSKLGRDSDIRISQISRYCTQALLGIPDDETRFQKALRLALEYLEPAAKIVSGTLGGDAAKLVELVKDYKEYLDPASIVAFFNGLENFSEGIKDFPEIVVKMREKIESAYELQDLTELWQHQESWYLSLQYAQMFIEAGAFNLLRHYLYGQPSHSRKGTGKKAIRLLRNEDFLSGLLSYLEQTWLRDQHRQRIVDFLQNQLFPDTIGTLKSQYAISWAWYIAVTLGLHDWSDRLGRKRKSAGIFRKEVATKLKAHPPGHTPSNPKHLFTKAWLQCEQAQLFYADATVRQYYIDADLLKIERISGDPLDMEYCYINVAILNQSSDASLTLFERLNINEEGSKRGAITLPSIFESQMGNGLCPKRVLIRGIAGVGKTTLCKKMVYRFLDKRERLWSRLFDRLLWIPLRKLKRSLEATISSTYNHEQLLRDMFFSSCHEDEASQFSKALFKAVRRSRRDPRTLFILDGLDEVSHMLGSGENETHAARFLKDLLDFEAVIVTTRPSGINSSLLKPFDLELETVGFDTDQVRAYTAMANPEGAAFILEFLEHHALIKGLASIPIQLDAFCFTWDPKRKFEELPTTMTELYETIATELWRNTLHRISPQLSHRAESFSPTQVKIHVQGHSKLLQSLAFTGMCNGIIEFDTSMVAKVADILSQDIDAVSTLVTTDLLQTPFLRASDSKPESWSVPSSKTRHTTYHFMHLTYQEFFAAQFLVDKLLRRSKLWWWDSTTKTTQEMEPFSFLSQYKYGPHFDIILRFVTGLLSIQSSNEAFNFLSALDFEPVDILRVSHRRLILHCYSEISSAITTHDSRMNDYFTRRLLSWARHDVHALTFPLQDGHYHVLDQQEFPPHLRCHLLNGTERTATVAFIGRKSVRISEDELQLIARYSHDTPDTEEYALRIFWGHGRLDLIVRHLIPPLKMREERIVGVFIRLLMELVVKAPLQTLSDSLIVHISACLHDSSPRVTKATLSLLCLIKKKQGIPDTVRKIIMTLFLKTQLSREIFGLVLNLLIKSESPEYLTKHLFCGEQEFDYDEVFWTCGYWTLGSFEELLKLATLLDSENRPLKTIAALILRDFVPRAGSFPGTWFTNGTFDPSFARQILDSHSVSFERKVLTAKLALIFNVFNDEAASFLHDTWKNNGDEEALICLFIFKDHTPDLINTIHTLLQPDSGYQLDSLLKTLIDFAHLPERLWNDLVTMLRSFYDADESAKSFNVSDSNLKEELLRWGIHQPRMPQGTYEELVMIAQQHLDTLELIDLLKVSTRNSMSVTFINSLYNRLYTEPMDRMFGEWRGKAEPLLRQGSVPHEIQELLVESLGKMTRAPQKIAADVFASRHECHVELIRMDEARLKHLLLLWQALAVERHLTVQIFDHQLRIWDSGGLSVTPFEHEAQERTFREVIDELSHLHGGSEGSDDWETDSSEDDSEHDSRDISERASDNE